MRQPFTKEAIIGVIAVATLSIVYFGINYLKGINIFNPSNFYYVAYDNVTDLTPSNPVYVDGFKVGQVHEIRYNYNNPSEKIIVVLDLDKALKIPEGSKASLSVAMLGSASINLELNKYVSTYHSTGDTLTGVSSLGIMSKVENELMTQLQQMLPGIDSILIAFNHV
ncbi:MAG: MlaD family protein, partial [Bacteroidales bacterium]